jgi:hypothetical protein
MKKALLLAVCLFLVTLSQAQSFEVIGVGENYKGFIGELIRVPVQFKNTTNKNIVLIIRKAESQIGSTQKNFLCPEGNCDNPVLEDYILRVEPGQTVQNFSIGLEAGLVQGISRVKYIVYNRSNPAEMHEIEVNFSVEERPVKNDIFTSRHITIHEVYPNPVSDIAHIEYHLLSDNVKAKIVIHNILGNALAEYELPPSESKVKLKADELTAGIYFYTLYLENEGIMTRKLIVKR